MLRAFSVFFLSLSFVFSDDIAIVKTISGDSFAKRDQAMVELKVGNQLQIGDTLITKSNSSIGIIFHDGTVLSLGENSILSIDEFLFKPLENKFNFDINMQKGLASFESGKIGDLSPQSVKFRVPEGTVGIRGTKFYVKVK